MEFKVVGFTVAPGASREAAFEGLAEIAGKYGGKEVRRWQVEDESYLVVRGPADAAAIADAADRLPLELTAIGRTELPGSATDRLPAGIDFDPGLRAASDEDAIDFTLRLCMGCGVPLPASRTEHAQRNCPIA